MLKNALEFLSPKTRQTLYVVFTLIGLGLGATSVGYNAADLTNPVWLNVAQEVYLFIGVGFGVVASTNVTPDTDFSVTHLE